MPTTVGILILFFVTSLAQPNSTGSDSSTIKKCECRRIPGFLKESTEKASKAHQNLMKAKIPQFICSKSNRLVEDLLQFCKEKDCGVFKIQNINDPGLSKENPGASCLALSELGAQLPGVYWIKPSGSYSAFRTYCREEGWSLIMKIDGRNQTFTYNSSLWTSESTFNSESVELDDFEAKLASFWTLPFEELLLGLKTDGELNWITLHRTASSLRSLFIDNVYRSTNIGRDAWKSLISQSSLQLNCNKEGFNVRVGHTRVRIGISSNEQNDCDSNDSFLGFGSAGEISCGNFAIENADNGDRKTSSSGYIFAR